jgi:hypothetical protein
MSLESDDLRNITFEKKIDDNINKENLMVKYFGKHIEKFNPTTTKNTSLLGFAKCLFSAIVILGLLYISGKTNISNYFNVTPNVYLNNTLLYSTYFLIIFIIIITL